MRPPKVAKAAAGQLPPRLTRAESFLGVHFDFHAGPDSTRVGARTTRASIEEIIRKVAPDYLQCDCKGHAGVSSYPSRVGNRAPGFVRDPLRIWREVTARQGVGLFMHYSGVWDHAALKRRPAWARIDEKGERDPNNTSVFGPYVDALLIPQLLELRDQYGVDGVWVDGDCWATCQDYGREVLSRFRRATGIRKIPRKPSDAHFFEFTEFCREGFRNYLRHYVDALHAHDPGFEIASNWAFSSMMPEPVSANIDFLSGDYSLQDSVRAARLEARCLMRQGKPWDLMAWSFAGRWKEPGYSTKTAVQLQQEAAVVLAVGGGFQVYFKQGRDASVESWPMNVMGEVAQFCRARQQACHRAEGVPQVALLYSSAAYYRKSARLFSPWSGELVPLKGLLCALLDGKQVVEVLSEHHLAARLDEYPVIVMPEWEFLEDAFRRELIAYVQRGGNLLVVGPMAARLFADELGVKLLGKPEKKARYIGHAGALAGVNSLGQEVKLRAGTKVLGLTYETNDTAGTARPVATLRSLGRGKMAGVYVNLGERYLKARTALARDFLGAMVHHLFPRPMVEVAGSHAVDVTLMKKGGRLLINLVNTAGPHDNESVYSFDEVPVSGPLNISVRLPARPREVRQEPGGRKLAFTFSQGVLRMVLPQLAIHEIISILPAATSAAKPAKKGHALR